MKKVIFIILTVFMFINITKAEMKENNIWQEEKIEGENVEVEYRYRFYKEKKVGRYIQPNLVDYYQFEDKDDVIYGPYSGYMSKCEEAEHLQIRNVIRYNYKEILPVKYIKILINSNQMLDIKEINVYNDSQEIENNIVFNDKNYVILSIKETPLRDLKINIELNNKNIEYQLLFSNDDKFTNNSIVASTSGNSNQNEYKYNVNFILYYNYTEQLTGYDIEIDQFIKVIYKSNMCQIRTIKTFHYNIERVYYDNDYYKDVNELNLSEDEKKEYKKDEDDYKIFYKIKNDNLIDNLDEEILNDKDAFVDEENDYVDIKEENNQNETTDSNEVGNENFNLNTNNDKILDIEKNNEIKLVKTGVNKKFNYNYLVVYILSLILVGLILIKKIKRMSIKKII